jgi:DNA-binding transcriptional ArsR family regulator
MADDDLVFRALADPTRRLLLDRLFERDGRTLTELEEETSRRVGEGAEDEVVIGHGRIIGDQMVTCQAEAAAAGSSC